MSRELIAVDIDDVLADSTESVRLQVNQLAGVDLSVEAYRMPGEYSKYYERVWEAHGLAVTFDDFASNMERDQTHVPVIVDAKQALKALSNQYDLAVVTARPEAWRGATKIWLSDHFDGLFNEVFFVEHRVDDQVRTKGHICAEIGASYLIDDNVAHAFSAVEQGLTGLLIGKYGWHQNVPPELVRCESWGAVVEYFNERD